MIQSAEKTESSLPLKHLGIVAAVILVFSVIGIYWLLANFSLGDLKTVAMDWVSVMSAYPVAVFIALLLVGGLPLPLSPVIIFAGVLFTDRYGLPAAVGICYLAMVLNMIWTYFLSAYPLRGFFEAILKRFSNKFPEVPEHLKSRVALIIRITPGIPFFLQNYFLGFSRVPFGKYLLISMAIQAFYTTGFVVGGGAIFQGKVGLAIAALCLLIVIGVVVSFIRKRQPSVPLGASDGIQQ